MAEQNPIPDNSRETATDPETPAYYRFVSQGQSISEGAGSFEIHVQRDMNSRNDFASVFLQISGDIDATDIASITQDSIPVPMLGSVIELQFLPYQVVASARVHLNDDTLYEPNERLEFTILPGGASAPEPVSFENYIVSILNNDPIPQMTFSLPASTVMEGNSKTFTVELSNPSYQDSRGLVKLIGGSVSATDHDFVETFITIPAGSTSANFSFNAIDEGVNELDETLVLQVYPSIGLQAPIANNTHVLTIQEAGAVPSFEFSAPAMVMAEGSTLMVQIDFTGTFDRELTLPLNISGTSKLGVDYHILQEEVVLPLGDNSVTFDITSFDDELFEEGESIVFTLQDQDYGIAGANSSLTVTVNDNEPAPELGFASDTYYSQEGSVIFLPIHLSSAFEDDVNLTFAVDPGSSASASDYTLIHPGTLQIYAQSPWALLPIVLNKDEVFEGNETLILNITSATFATYASLPALTVAQTTINIRETNDLPTINFLISDLNVSENDASFDVTVILDKAAGSDLDFSIDIATTAVNGVDYVKPALEHTIPTGSDTYTFTVSLVDDGIAEQRESLLFSLIQPTRMVLGERKSLEVQILDND